MHRPNRVLASFIAVSTACLFLCSANLANAGETLPAWKPSAKTAKKRLEEVGKWYKKHEDKLRARDAAFIAESFTRKEAPEWIKKTYWFEGNVKFAVGMVRGIRNTSMAYSVAGNRARVEMVKGQSVKQHVKEEKTAKGSSRVIKTQASGNTNASPVDWYIDKDGNFYALAVSIGE